MYISLNTDDEIPEKHIDAKRLHNIRLTNNKTTISVTWFIRYM